jgi:hypothetical protein
VPCSSEVVKLSRWSFAYKARGSASSSLNCYLSLHTNCKFFVDINSSFLLLKIDCLEPLSSFLYTVLSENLFPYMLSRLTRPVLAPPTKYLRGINVRDLNLKQTAVRTWNRAILPFQCSLLPTATLLQTFVMRIKGTSVSIL